jgi:hypothetical protein
VTEAASLVMSIHRLFPEAVKSAMSEFDRLGSNAYPQKDRKSNGISRGMADA